MALFYQKGTISEISEVQSGTSQSGKIWQRVNVILDTPGYQGTFQKMIFSASGERVKDVLLCKVGDKVEVGFTIYATEYNGKYYNHVDLIKIDFVVGDKDAAEQDIPDPAPATEEAIQDDLGF